MASKKRLIDAYTLAEEIESLQITVAGKPAKWNDAKHSVLRLIAEQADVDAVEVVRIKEVSQKILETLDHLISVDEPLANYTAPSSYYRGKVNAYEVARRLVNAAIADLCDNCGAKMDEAEADV